MCLLGRYAPQQMALFVLNQSVMSIVNPYEERYETYQVFQEAN